METEDSAALDSRNLTHVKLPVFEGPLDLLLYLIKKDELDIYDIPIEQITRRYLEYLQLIKMLDLEVAGEYLVVAATLVYIKSRVLLPHDQRPPEEEAEEDDPRWELVRQLVEYKKYKDAAFELSQCLAREENVHRRGAALKPETGRRCARLRQSRAFRSARRLPENPRARQPARGPARHLRGPLHGQRQDPAHPAADGAAAAYRVRGAFRGGASRTEIVVTFLAVLELIRLRQIDVAQEGPFAPIELVRARTALIEEVEDESDEEHEVEIRASRKPDGGYSSEG